MARVDEARRQVVLTDAELVVATQVGTDGFDPESAAARSWRTSLLASAAVTGGRLPGWLHELLTVVAAPALRIGVETLTTWPPVEYSIWATPRHAVAGTPRDDGDTELTLLEPVTIPWAVTQMVGLGRRPPAPGVPSLRIPASVLEAGESSVSAGESVESTRAALDGGDLAESQVGVLVELLRQRRMSWRASSVWTDSSGARRTRELSVIDAGGAGLWLVRVDPTNRFDPALTLEPTRASTIWQRIVELLPGTRS